MSAGAPLLPLPAIAAAEYLSAHLPRNIPPARNEPARHASGSALAMLMRDGAGAAWAHVYDAGGSGNCFPAVLSASLYGATTPRRVTDLRRRVADALACRRAARPPAAAAVRASRSASARGAAARRTPTPAADAVVFDALEVRAAEGVPDFAQLVHDAVANTPVLKDFYWRFLRTVDSATLRLLDVSAGTLSAAAGTIDPYAAIQSRRAALQFAMTHETASMRCEEVSFTDVELLLIELIFRVKIVLLMAENVAEPGVRARYQLAFRSLGQEQEMPRGKNVVYVGFVDGDSHAVLITPPEHGFGLHDNVRRLLPSGAPPTSASAAAQSTGASAATASAATASAAAATARSTRSTATSAPKALLPSAGSVQMQLPPLIASSDEFKSVLAAAHAKYGRRMEVRHSGSRYVRATCMVDKSCAAVIVYTHHKNSTTTELRLNVKDSLLRHTCAAPATATNATSAATSESGKKKRLHGIFGAADLASIAIKHSINPGSFTTRKAFMASVLEAAGATSERPAERTVSRAYVKTLEVMYGTRETVVGRLKPFLAALERELGPNCVTKIETEPPAVEGQPPTLKQCVIVLPYAKHLLANLPRRVSLDATFGKNFDVCLGGGTFTIIHLAVPGISTSGKQTASEEASLPLAIAFSIDPESAETTKFALKVLADEADAFNKNQTILQEFERVDRLAAVRRVQERKWLAMSDGAKGIPAALKEVTDWVRHVHSDGDFELVPARDVVHVARNCHAKIGSTVKLARIKQILYKLVREACETTLEMLLAPARREQLKKSADEGKREEAAVYEWLLSDAANVTLAELCVAQSRVPRINGAVTSNGAEGFNGVHATARKLPLLHALHVMVKWSIEHYADLRVVVLGLEAGVVGGRGTRSTESGASAAAAPLASAAATTAPQSATSSTSTAISASQTLLDAHERYMSDNLLPFYGRLGERVLKGKAAIKHFHRVFCLNSV